MIYTKKIREEITNLEKGCSYNYGCVMDIWSSVVVVIVVVTGRLEDKGTKLVPVDATDNKPAYAKQ